MSEMSIDTEPQKVALNHAIQCIREACVSLFDKKVELEKLEQSQETSAAISIVNLRLDALAKIELKLLAPLVNEYALIEQSAGRLQPGELSAMFESRQTAFVDSMMQGL